MDNNVGIAFGTLYTRALQELSSPDLNRIKLLRDLAKENVDKADHIVAAICGHLFTCAPSMRLAALYLVDCLMKNVPSPYASIFEQNLLTIFKFVWDEASSDPGLRAKLAKLAGTWETQRTVPVPLMSSIQAIMTPPAPFLGPALMPQSGLAAPGTTVSSHPAPQLLWPPLLPSMPFPPHQQNLLPSLTPQQQGWGSLPMPAPQLPGQNFPTLMLPGGQLLPMPYMSAAPPASAPAPSALQQPAPLAAMDLAATLESLGRRFGMHTSAAAAAAGDSGPIPSAGIAQPPTHAPKAWAGQAPLTLPPHVQDTQQQRQQQPQRITITQSNIKEYCQPAVDQLLASSDATRSKFLDLQFLRNRRAKSTSHRSRPWFVGVDQWLEGTRADDQGAGQGFFEEGEQGPGGVGAEAEPVPQLVEEDPAQPTCAISGETFERMYDPDTDKWYFEDAVVLWGEQASNAGVMEGSIVKVHCLAGAPAPLSASLGLGPVQQKPVDDVTPALMDAAADAEAELPGAADANGVGGRKEGAGASMSSAGVDNRQQLNQAQLQGALPAPASAVIAGRPPHGDGQHSLMGSAERDKQAAGGLHAREVQSGVSTAVQAEVQQTEIDMPASKRAKTAD